MPAPSRQHVAACSAREDAACQLQVAAQGRVGLASALAIVLMVLVLLVVGPLQRLVQGKGE